MQVRAPYLAARKGSPRRSLAVLTSFMGIVWMEAHHVRKGIGQFGRAAQGDLLLGGRSGEFVVIVHGKTVSRRPRTRDPCG